MFSSKMSQVFQGILKHVLPMVHIFTRTYNSSPYQSAASRKLQAPSTLFEILPAIGQLGGMPLFPTDRTPRDNPGSITRLLSYSKSLYELVVFVEAYTYTKKQHHISIYSWHIADLILRITFESNRCICVCLTTSKKLTS